MNKPGNVEWLYKGMISRRSEPKLLIAGATLLAAQLLLAVFFLF